MCLICYLIKCSIWCRKCILFEFMFIESTDGIKKYYQIKNAVHNFLYLFQHVEVPLPTPSKDEVLIKLEAASLNPFDWKVQKGMLWPLLPSKFPYIPGSFPFLSFLFRCLSLSYILEFELRTCSHLQKSKASPFNYTFYHLSLTRFWLISFPFYMRNSMW